MSKKKIQKMSSDEKHILASNSAPVLFPEKKSESSLLEEINKQTEAELTPKLEQRKLEGLQLSTDLYKDSDSADSDESHGSFHSEPHDLDLTLTDSKSFTNSEPFGSSVFTEDHAPNSSHLGILLLTNARRKLELEEERLEFEKEKKREKEKRKAKKLFFKLSKRVKDKSTMHTVLPSSVSDGGLKKIEEDDISSTYSTVDFDRRNASTDSGLIPSSAEERDETPEEKIKRLEKELKEACRHAVDSDRRCEELKKLQKSLDNEVQDLTETLFQEAYKLANAAEARREHAEKLLSEALLKVDLLQAEVKALKEIVKSTGRRTTKDKSNSHKTGILTTPKTKSKNSKQGSPQSNGSISFENSFDLDPVCYPEFKEWRNWASNNSEEENSKFFKRIMMEDVKPCLNSVDEALSEEVLSSIKKNTLEIEPICNSTGTLRTCAFTKKEGHCPYRLRTDCDKDWVFVSLFARNRITAVCDLFTYLRYLKNGIVKASDEDAFAEITVMKKNLALARFGFDFVTKMNGSGLTDKD